MKKLICLLVLAFMLVGCAKPPTDRAERLRQDGKDLTAYNEEVKAQMDKFALFRSFLKADQILDQIEQGMEPVRNSESMSAGRCVEVTKFDDGVVCYRNSCMGGISCVKVK